MRTPTELTEAFRERGLRVTPQRQLLFRLLHQNEQHPTAEALFAQATAEMPGISLRTVYQTLTDLSGLGEIQTLDLGTGSTRFDPNVADHHHLVCTGCGQVRDVRIEATSRPVPSDDLDGFSIEQTHVVFRGHCSSCRTTV